MKILIITYSDDNISPEIVSKAIEAKGGSVIRFNNDHYPQNCSLQEQYKNGTHELIYIDENHTRHNLSDVDAIWYRRSVLAKGLDEILDEKFLDPAKKEIHRTFWGQMSALQKFTIDTYQKIRYAENKPLQLKVAQSLGLSIPRSLITNDPEAVKTFYQECPKGIVTKMMSSFSIYENDQEQVVFTSKIDEKDLEEMEGLKYCPMTFQELIEKKLELRITIVGTQVFTAAIDSQQTEKSKIDWRKDGMGLSKQWFSYELPAAIQNKLLQLMDHFKLNYGAIDLIVTPEDEYVFLEINPAGEFYWLEMHNQMPISAAIADVLMDKTLRR